MQHTPGFTVKIRPGLVIDRAVDQMIERLDMDPADAAAIAEAEAAAERNRSSEGGFPIGGLIWFAFIFFFTAAKRFFMSVQGVYWGMYVVLWLVFWEW